MLKFIINLFFLACLINSSHAKIVAWPADFLFNQEDFIHATQEQRSIIMNSVGDLFKEMEKRNELQVQLKEGTLKICTNGGLDQVRHLLLSHPDTKESEEIHLPYRNDVYWCERYS